MIEPLVIRGSRWIYAAYMAASMVACLLFFVIGYVVLPAELLLVLWPVLISFGLGAVAFGWFLIRPFKIALDAEGFTFSGGGRTCPKIAWRHVKEFFVLSSPGLKFVCLNYEPDAPDVRRNPALIRFARKYGAEGAIGWGFELPAEQVADTLNSYRRRALS
jgi:hypothetical protein